MLEGVWYGIAAALVFFGLISAVYIITVRVFKSGSEGRMLVVLSDEISGCEIGSVLYAAHLRLALWGDCRNGRIIIVDNGMTEKQIDICKKIMSECGSMELCRPHELAGMITGKE